MWLYLLAMAAALQASVCVAETSHGVLEVVRNFTRVKILESNNVGLRPGSIYDNITVFESLFGFPRPGFNYEFVDSGLGAAEPLYPMYQKGHQGSWFQLIPAFFSKKSRHIDHYTSLTTPENCKVEGLYGLRHIDEYPKDMFVKERAEGYEQIVVRLDYYTRLTQDAQCGRHKSNDPDPGFNPMKFVKKYHRAKTFADFPKKDLDRFEWKLYTVHHMSEERNRHKWPRFDLDKLKHNSLWYYPDGHAEDYGVSEPRPQAGLSTFMLPKHLLVSSTPELRRDLPLGSLLGSNEFSKVMDFLDGHPTPEFRAADEPGHDTLNLADITAKNIYTSGLYLEHIQDVRADVADPSHYALAGMTIKPFEAQDDYYWQGTRTVPQIRFVYQLMDPRHPDRAFEQLYLHLKFDVVDRHADRATRDAQHQAFLKRVDELTAARERADSGYHELLLNFIRDYTARPIESIAFSSSLTGIWTFGTLTRSHHPDRELRAMRIVRDGIDVGYYSSTYDGDIFRRAIETAEGDEKARLTQHMEDLTTTFYRDPKRQDAEAINFNRVTCAQCHQTSGRDGVHISLNDGIDRRYTAETRASEYFFRDADRQLMQGRDYWNSEHP